MQRVIDHDLARKKEHGKLIAEGPALHGVGHLGLQGFAAVEARKLHLRVVADRALSLGQLLPSLPCRQAGER